MQSTIYLFRHLYNQLPPLFPEDIKVNMAKALEKIEHSTDITLNAIEEVMIKFGYLAWPWNKAYREFFLSYELQMGEHFLLPKVSSSLKQRYEDFKTYGGTLSDLHSGRPADFFTSEERGELCSALIEMRQELVAYTNRMVVGMEKKNYLEKVKKFTKIAEDIQATVNHLRELANKEEDHPMLAQEIISRVESFEHSLCLLGPELDYEAVCRSVDHFQGRREDLNRLRGIHLPLEVDFYSEL